MHAILVGDDVGEKLWPVTSAEFPKCLLPIYSASSVLHDTIERLFPFLDTGGNDMIMTMPDMSVDMLYLIGVMEQFGIPITNLITTRCYKGSFYSILASCLLLDEKGVGDDEVIIISPTDQFFAPTTSIMLHIKNLLLEHKMNSDSLVAMSLPAGGPSVLLNYMQAEKPLKDLSDSNQEDERAGDGFTRRESVKVVDYNTGPDFETAASLVSNGWLWDIDTYAISFGLLKRCVYDYVRQTIGDVSGLDELYINWDDLNFTNFSEAILPSLVEQGKVRTTVVPQVIWVVLDNWVAIKHLLIDSELYENQTSPDIHLVGSSDNLVFKPPGKKVVLYGIDDLVIIDTHDKLLIGTPGALHDDF
jgi:mannose-1-phosphate guanylyltransferase